MRLSHPRHLFEVYTSSEPGHADAYIGEAVMRRLKGVPAGGRVLDAGCGNGHFTNRLSVAGFDAMGIDLAGSGIDLANKSFTGLRFATASVYDDLLKLFGHKFDAVVSLEVIEHLYDPRAFLRRIRECLKPGGTLILSTPYHGYAKNLLIALTNKFDWHMTALWDGGHIKFWSRRTLSSLLNEAGFRVDSFDGAGGVPFVWKSMVISATASGV